VVERNALQEVNEKLSASSIRVVMVHIDQCELLEKNARFMRAEQYKQLVDNIRADGCLTSVPFALKIGDRYRILSGNHRVTAAKDAGLTEIPVLCTDQALTHQKQLAIQLSHNAIAGQDDLAILRELYDEIAEVTLKEYSGLDDVGLGRMEPPQLDPLSEATLEYRVVSIAFLPPEVERAEKLFEKVMTLCDGDSTWVNRFSEYDKMLDLLTAAKASAGVKNTATALGLLLDIAEKYIDELPKKPVQVRPLGKKAKKKEPSE